MLESKIQASIRNWLKKEGWMVWKNTASKNGIPDLTAIKNGRFIFIEVKQENKKVSPIQDYQISELRKHQMEVFIVHSLKELITTITHIKNESED